MPRRGDPKVESERVRLQPPILDDEKDAAIRKLLARNETGSWLPYDEQSREELLEEAIAMELEIPRNIPTNRLRRILAEGDYDEDGVIEVNPRRP